VDDRDDVSCHDWLVVIPSEIPNDINISNLAEDYSSLSSEPIKRLFEEYKKDQTAISQMVEQNRLDMFFNLCSSIIRDQLTQDDARMIE
jgi:hypothetical protein